MNAAMPATAPELTIIIPTFNRAHYVLSTVEQVLAQDFGHFELFVIDQSEPTQQAIVESGMERLTADKRLTYIHLPVANLPQARNVGLSRARGRIVMFLDDDVVLLNPSFLRAHVDCYEDKRIGGVTGRTIERINRENTSRTANRITPGGRTVINLLGLDRCEIHSLKGANMSVRAEAIAGLGGFDRNYTGTALLEEADFAERIRQRGWRFIFEPRAELLHLSAPGSGVRVVGKGEKDFYRFRSTTYFVRKNRGLAGMVPFALTHLLVAAVRTAKTRDPALPGIMWKGAVDGWSRFNHGIDQEVELPEPMASKVTAQSPVASTADI